MHPVASLTRAGVRAATVRVTGVAGQSVVLQRYDGRRCVTVTTYRAVASRTLTRLTAGRWYRAVVSATATLGGVTSNSARI